MTYTKNHLEPARSMDIESHKISKNLLEISVYSNNR